MMKIKICGLKTPADVAKINQYKPEYIGFVFANTKRFVTDEQALEMKGLLDRDIKAVGVFVDEPLEHVISLCSRGIIDVVQLHGAESEEYIRELKQKTDITVIKATKVQTAEQVSRLMSEEADYMLFDTYKKGALGGTGERFSLEILEQSLNALRAQGKQLKPYFLAGGLDCHNVAEVLQQVKNSSECVAVDVSTGVETEGVKDEAKIRAFIDNVRKMNKS